jgi:hypothetical protein
MRSIHNILTDVEQELVDYALKFKLRFKRDRGNESIYILRVWQRNTYIPAKIEFIIDRVDDGVIASVIRQGDLCIGVINIINRAIMSRF